MEGLPKEIRIPAQLVHRAKVTYHAVYVEQTIRDVSERFGMRVVEDSSLGFPTPLSFEVGIGQAVGGIDYNDLPQLPPCATQFKFWYKFHATSEHEPFGNVFSFSPCSFQNWHQYRELAPDIRYSANPDGLILNNQRSKIVLRSQVWAESLTRRRSLVRQTLASEYGDRVDTALTEQVAYWRKATACLVSVHVPGLWNNMLDRAQLQMMAFGVCTISPVIYTRLGDMPPTPGVHYVACRNDYSDLIEQIEFCRKNTDRCREIGAEAKRLFQQTSTPEAIWKRIGRETLKAASGY